MYSFLKEHSGDCSKGSVFYYKFVYFWLAGTTENPIGPTSLRKLSHKTSKCT